MIEIELSISLSVSVLEVVSAGFCCMLENNISSYIEKNIGLSLKPNLNLK